MVTVGRQVPFGSRSRNSRRMAELGIKPLAPPSRIIIRLAHLDPVRRAIQGRRLFMDGRRLRSSLLTEEELRVVVSDTLNSLVMGLVVLLLITTSSRLMVVEGPEDILSNRSMAGIITKEDLEDTLVSSLLTEGNLLSGVAISGIKDLILG